MPQSRHPSSLFLSSSPPLITPNNSLKNASPTKQEHTRLEVENAEDNLMQKTEVTITLMKTVLENPEPIKNLNELTKAQLLYFSTAAEALSTVQGEIDELSVAAEGQYRSIQSPSFSNTPHSRCLESPTTTEVPL
ncbi:hypothetical protein J132_00017 [Termitomyces sp. J132]|nr:hypothetical protein J132_00017 [Termitomyces sp. J132]